MILEIFELDSTLITCIHYSCIFSELKFRIYFSHGDSFDSCLSDLRKLEID